MFSTPLKSASQDPFVASSSKPKMSALAPVFQPIGNGSTTARPDPLSFRPKPGTVEYLKDVIRADEMKNSFTVGNGKMDLLSIYGSTPPSGFQNSTFEILETAMSKAPPPVTTPVRPLSDALGAQVNNMHTPLGFHSQIPPSFPVQPFGDPNFQTPQAQMKSPYESMGLGNFTPPQYQAVTFTPGPNGYAMVPLPMTGLYASPFSPNSQFPSHQGFGSSPNHIGMYSQPYTSPSAGYGNGYHQGVQQFGGYGQVSSYNQGNRGYNQGYQSGGYLSGPKQHNRLANRHRRNGQGNSIHNVVDVDRIRAGLDVRTTVMLRNIPNKITQAQLLAIINESSYGAYDFLYLRIDFSNQCNVGYAFVNFVDPLDIIRFVDARANKKWYMFRSEKVAEVSYATIQGRDCLIQKFRNSSVMLEPEFCRPKLFFTRDDVLGRAGQEDPFPASDNASKLKRSCENAENVGWFNHSYPTAHAYSIGLYAPTAGQALRDEQRRRRSQFDRGTTLAEQDELEEWMEEEWMLASSPYQPRY